MVEREVSRIRRWTKWGMIAGWVLAMLYVNAWSPAQLGFYVGPVPLPLVFAVFVGGGALIGAGFAWLQRKLPPPDDGVAS